MYANHHETNCFVTSTTASGSTGIAGAAGALAKAVVVEVPLPMRSLDNLDLKWLSKNNRYAKSYPPVTINDWMY